MKKNSKVQFWDLVLKIWDLPLADGAVAQSVEQRTENPCVAGSIPAHTTENQAVTAKVVAAFVFGHTLVTQLSIYISFKENCFTNR
jgi:hypothetical protein